MTLFNQAVSNYSLYSYFLSIYLSFHSLFLSLFLSFYLHLPLSFILLVFVIDGLPLFHTGLLEIINIYGFHLEMYSIQPGPGPGPGPGLVQGPGTGWGASWWSSWPPSRWWGSTRRRAEADHIWQNGALKHFTTPWKIYGLPSFNYEEGLQNVLTPNEMPILQENDKLCFILYAQEVLPLFI